MINDRSTCRPLPHVYGCPFVICAAIFCAFGKVGANVRAFAEDSQPEVEQSQADGDDDSAEQPAASQPADEDSKPARPAACETLQAEIAKSRTSAERTIACLNAARCALITDCAPPLSLLLNGGTGGPELLRVVQRGLGHLECAETALGETAPDMLDKAERKRIRRRIDMLKAFGHMFAALAEDDGSEAARSRLGEACLNLSIYMDVANLDVVESAKLYSAAAYRRVGRPDRAAALLLPAVTPYSSNRVEFLGRLERCRALADGGQYIAALALANRLSNKSEAWFRSQGEAVQKRASDSVRWLGAEIYRRWIESVRKAGDDRQIKAVEKLAVEFFKDHHKPLPASKWLQLTVTIEGVSDWSQSSTGSDETTRAPATTQDAEEP